MENARDDVRGRVSLRQSLAEMANEARLHPELAFGFALLWAWTRLAFGTSAFDGAPLFGCEAQPIAEAVLVLSNASAYLAIGVLFKLCGTVFHGRLYCALVTLAMSVGCALCAASSSATDSADASLALCLVGAVLVGAGVSFVYVEWGRILGMLGPRCALVHACFGILGSAAVLLALHALPAIVQNCYLVAAPVAVMAVVWVWTRRGASKMARYGAETEFHAPWRLLVTMALVGMAFGVASEVNGLGNYLEPSLVRNALTFAVTAVLLVFSAVLFKMDFNQLIYRVGIPIAAAGCLVFVVFADARAFGGFVFSAGYLFLDLLVWVLLAHIIKHQEISANWIVALVTGFLLFGRLAGVLAAGSVAAASHGSSSAHSGLLVVLAYALMLCALLMANKRNMLVGWGSTRPAENDAESALGAACRMLGSDCGLTPRETEICMLFARGYSRETISNTLTLSKETVRTHAANIYKKLGVHSHQELIILVEQRSKALDDR